MWLRFSFVAFSKPVKGGCWMITIIQDFLYSYRLLDPYFILNEVFFMRLYNTPYLMPVNCISLLPCLLVCVFLILFSAPQRCLFCVYDLSRLFFVKKERHAVLPFSCGLYVVVCTWNYTFEEESVIWILCKKKFSSNDLSTRETFYVRHTEYM
jgi:hypothetical protein